MMRSGGLFLTVIILCFSLTSCASRAAQEQGISRTGFFFDTVIEIRIFDKDADAALLDDCMELCNRYEHLFSAHIEDSDIARINASGRDAVTVDEESGYLIAVALNSTKRMTDAFDITIGGVSSLWNFTGDPPGPVPDEAQIRDALSHVGADRITVRFADAHLLAPEDLTGDELFHGVRTARVTRLDPRTQIDLGAVAKGYVADRLKSYLTANGVKSALINLGGNVLAVGEKSGDAPFAVGIRAPEGDRDAFDYVVEITDKSVVTSGNYERFFEEDGVRYHHILDARTGHPADTGVVSVTVITNDSLSGDLLSTVLFLMGAEEGLLYAETLPETEAFWILTDGSTVQTSSFPLR